ncbi:MAG TPA: NHL repeat-containing protein [Solirubrobacteraceae bacterium]|nr:NHL repeat-containing protein [Solirubrobacteraceae bacterium]
MRRASTLLAGAVVLCVLVPAAPAAADCPGALPASTCAYTAIGQVGQSAQGVLRFPQAVAVAPDGSVVVGDQGSHVVQVFAPDGTFLRAIGSAGTKPGQLTSVGSVAVAPDGSIFVAEGTSRIERYAADGTHLRTITGNGTAVGRFHFGTGRGNDSAAGGGLATIDSTLFVSDSANNRILRMGLDGSNPIVLVPPGQLQFPRGIAVRKTRLLVADDQHHRVVAYDTGGHFLKVVGSGQGAGPGQMNNPYGVALDAAGRVFVADDLNQRILRFSTLPDYAYRARWGAYGTDPGRLAYPRSIATDPQGQLYVANTGNDRIDVFSQSGQLLRSFGTSGRASGQFDAPVGVAADAAGFRAVTDSVNGRVEFLRPDGGVATIWGSPAPGPTVLPDAVAVAFDSAGNGYVLDERRSRIVVFSRASGKPVRTIGSKGTGAGQMLDPEQLAIASDGTIVVADTGNGRIVRFRTDGKYLGATTGIGRPHGVAITPDGARTYVARGNNHITAYSPAGTEIDDFGGTGNKLGKLNAPAQLSLDADGNLWVADRGNNRVQEFGPYGQRLAAFGVRGTGPGQFVHPTGVSVDCNGLVTVADTGNNRVQQFALAAPASRSCGQLPPPGNPPAVQLPTLPTPLGPQITPLRVLRSTGVLSGRNVPVRVGCESACTLTVGGSVTQAGRPAAGRTRASATLKAITVKLDAGQSMVLRPSLTVAQARTLSRALHGLRGLVVNLTFTAAGSDSSMQPTERTVTLNDARA